MRGNVDKTTDKKSKIGKAVKNESKISICNCPEYRKVKNLHFKDAKFAVYFDCNGDEVGIDIREDSHINYVRKGQIMKEIAERNLLFEDTSLDIQSKSVLRFHRSPGCTIWVGGIEIIIC